MARVRLDRGHVLLRAGRRPALLRPQVMPAGVVTPLASSSGSFLISPNVGLMIWTLVLFVVSMGILAKLAFPRISEVLERRQKAIEDSIDAAERTRVEADKMLDEYRERLKEARHQADEIVSRAQKAAETVERESRETSDKKRAELLEQTKRDIEAETRRAID